MGTSGHAVLCHAVEPSPPVEMHGYARSDRQRTAKKLCEWIVFSALVSDLRLLVGREIITSKAEHKVFMTCDLVILSPPFNSKMQFKQHAKMKQCRDSIVR